MDPNPYDGIFEDLAPEEEIAYDYIPQLDEKFEVQREPSQADLLYDGLNQRFAEFRISKVLKSNSKRRNPKRSKITNKQKSA